MIIYVGYLLNGDIYCYHIMHRLMLLREMLSRTIKIRFRRSMIELSREYPSTVPYLDLASRLIRLVTGTCDEDESECNHYWNTILPSDLQFKFDIPKPPASELRALRRCYSVTGPVGSGVWQLVRAPSTPSANIVEPGDEHMPPSLTLPPSSAPISASSSSSSLSTVSISSSTPTPMNTSGGATNSNNRAPIVSAWARPPTTSSQPTTFASLASQPSGANAATAATASKTAAKTQTNPPAKTSTSAKKSSIAPWAKASGAVVATATAAAPAKKDEEEEYRLECAGERRDINQLTRSNQILRIARNLNRPAIVALLKAIGLTWSSSTTPAIPTASHDNDGIYS
jgi:cytoskeletal protein RodZ